MNMQSKFASHIARKLVEQCRLCPAKLESNADFALQNHGDMVQEPNEKEKKKQIYIFQTLLMV